MCLAHGRTQNNMREWLSWWSTTLPRSGSRVRVPSRALIKFYIADVFRIGNTKICASGSVGGARPCQGRGRGFESRLALWGKEIHRMMYLFFSSPAGLEHVSSLHSGRCLTASTGRWLLRSVPVRAEQTSTGRLASPFHSGRCLTASTGRWLLRSAPVRVEQINSICPCLMA